MVFGQVYDHPLTCSKEEARCCWTIDDRIRVTSEPHFQDYVRDTHLFDKHDRKLPPKEDLPTPHYDLKLPPEDIMSINDQLKSPSGFLEGTEADGDLFEDAQQLGDVVSPTMFSPVQECTDTGICFGPNCVERCFIHNIFSFMDDKKCSHTWTTVDLSQTGEHVSFPSSFFH